MSLDSEFVKKLPKIELHAHLNGSIEIPTLRRLLSKSKDDSLPEGIESALDRYEQQCQLNEIADFFGLFKYIYPLTNHKEAVIFATEQVIGEFASDGCVYLELRSTPRITSHLSKEEYVQALLKGIKQGMETYPQITVRAILSVDRRHSLEEAMEIVSLAEKYMSQGVVGIDLCGDPYVGAFSTLKPAFEYAREANLKVTLHVAEIHGIEEETRQLLSYRPDRIGHGTFLDEAGRDALITHNIPIEVCVTSNLICKTVSHIQDHHFKDFHFEDHPCILCTDDKGVFHCSLTGEYAKVGEAFRLSRSELYELSKRAIDHIFDDDMKPLLYSKYESFRNSQGL